MMRSQRYRNVSLKRLAIISIDWRQVGICSASISADSSTNTSAEASRGSKKPDDKPIATQLFCQKCARCPEVMGISRTDRKSTRLNSSHVAISYAVFCLKKKKKKHKSGD